MVGGGERRTCLIDHHYRYTGLDPYANAMIGGGLFFGHASPNIIIQWDNRFCGRPQQAVIERGKNKIRVANRQLDSAWKREHQRIQKKPIPKKTKMLKIRTRRK